MIQKHRNAAKNIKRDRKLEGTKPCVALLSRGTTPLLSLGSIITSPSPCRAARCGPLPGLGSLQGPKTFLPLARHHNGATRAHAICGLFMIALGPAAAAVLSCRLAPLLVFISGESPLGFGVSVLLSFFFFFLPFLKLERQRPTPSPLALPHRSVASSPR